MRKNDILPFVTRIALRRTVFYRWKGVGKIESRKRFLMQMYERERIYKSDYDNLEIV